MSFRCHFSVIRTGMWLGLFPFSYLLYVVVAYMRSRHLIDDHIACAVAGKSFQPAQFSNGCANHSLLLLYALLLARQFIFLAAHSAIQTLSGLTADANILIDHARVIAARHFYSERVNATRCFSHSPVSNFVLAFVCCSQINASWSRCQMHAAKPILLTSSPLKNIYRNPSQWKG